MCVCHKDGIPGTLQNITFANSNHFEVFIRPGVTCKPHKPWQNNLDWSTSPAKAVV